MISFFRRHALIVLLSAGWVGVVPSRTAQATTLMLQRFDRPLVQDFLVAGPEGQIVARIQRAKWRQVWRRSYEARDIDGQLLGWGSQPLALSGMYFPSWSNLNFYDADGKLIGSVGGRLCTLLAASFDVHDAEGRAVASVVLDDHAQALLITSAARSPVLLFGQALRVQQASAGRDSWTLEVDDEAVGAQLAPIWPLMLAFFAEHFEEFTRADVSR